MDTQSDSTSALDVNQAAAAFATAFDPQPAIPEETKVDTEIDLKKAEETPSEPVEASEAEPAEEPQTVPVVINGKTVEVPITELTASYQKDKAASEKFEQAAALRKTADAEIAKTQQERASYAANLERMGLQLEVALQSQAQTDWAALLRVFSTFFKQTNLLQDSAGEFLVLLKNGIFPYSIGPHFVPG